MLRGHVSGRHWYGAEDVGLRVLQKLLWGSGRSLWLCQWVMTQKHHWGVGSSHPKQVRQSLLPACLPERLESVWSGGTWVCTGLSWGRAGDTRGLVGAAAVPASPLR